MTGRRRRPTISPATLMGGAALVLLAAAPPVAAAPFRVESSLEPRVAGLGEGVRFTIEVQGPGYEQPRLRPRFELRNLKIVAGPDSKHGISLGGPGRESGWYYSWTWWLKPTAVGSAGVDEVYLLVGEREVELPRRSIEVLPESLPGRGEEGESTAQNAFEELLRRTRERFLGVDPRDEGGGPDLFLRAVATPARPYVGQRVLYTVYLYTRVNVRAAESESLPSFQGLWARRVDHELPGAEPAEWDGALYTRRPLLRKELFPLAPRSYRIEPVRARFVVDRIARDRLFSTAVRIPVERTAESNPIELDVQPLPPPTGAGASFSGVVGRLALDVELAPEEVAVGQGATLTVTATGDGHLEALPAPGIEPPPGIELIGPQPVPPPRGDDAGGARCWQYLLVPRRAGSFRLPPVEVGYFEPASAEYRVARALPPELVAHPATVADVGVSEPPRPIRSAALPTPPEPFWRSRLPWAFALPWVAALVVILVRRRTGGTAGTAGVRHGLPGFRRRLGDALREERPRRAAASLERAWRELLVEALGIPPQVPAASWSDELLERGADREACGELRKLLDDLHYLRFAPELSATSALAGELAARSERIAREIVRR